MSLSTPRAELYLLAVGLASSSLRNAAWLEPYTWHLTLQEMPHPQHGLCPLLEDSPHGRMSRSVALQQTTRIAKRSFIQTSLWYLRGPLCMQLGERAQQRSITDSF
jgi:hypothetical protein